MNNYGKVWVVMAGCEKIWPGVGGYKKNMAGCGRVFQGVKRYGWGS